VDELEKKGVIGTGIAAAKNLPPLALEAMRRNQRIGRPDPDYRED